MKGINIEEPSTVEVVSENQVNNTLVSEAYEKLINIFSDNFELAMTEAGEYLLAEFFNGEIELARAKKSPKEETLNQLIERLKNKSLTTPSKS